MTSMFWFLIPFGIFWLFISCLAFLFRRLFALVACLFQSCSMVVELSLFCVREAIQRSTRRLLLCTVPQCLSAVKWFFMLLRCCMSSTHDFPLIISVSASINELIYQCTYNILFLGWFHGNSRIDERKRHTCTCSLVPEQAICRIIYH